MKTTIPKEFQLKTGKRNESNKKQRDLNIFNRRQKNINN